VPSSMCKSMYRCAGASAIDTCRGNGWPIGAYGSLWRFVDAELLSSCMYYLFAMGEEYTE
jgi:hypothetical protein